MGADFILAVCPQVVLSDRTDQEDHKGRWKKIGDLIASLTGDDFRELYDSGFMSDGSLGDLEWDDLETLRDSVDPFAEAREEILQAVDVATTLDHGRETGDIRLDGMDWTANVTGGLSWGDAPTSVSGSYFLVSSVPGLYRLLLEMSREDFVEQVLFPPTPVIRVRWGGDEEPTYEVLEGGPVAVQLVDAVDESQLAIEYNGVRVYHADRKGNLSEHWLAPTSRCDVDNDLAYDVRDLPAVPEDRVAHYLNVLESRGELASTESENQQKVLMMFAIDQGVIDGEGHFRGLATPR